MPSGGLSGGAPPREPWKTLCELEAAPGYCHVGYNGDYVRTLGMISTFCHYMLVYTKLSTVVSFSAASSVVAIGWLLVAQQYFVWDVATPEGEARQEVASWGLYLYSPFVLWWVFSHLIGLLHYRLRSVTLWQSKLLKKRHHRLLASIREETEHCERLLRNILPPHVLHHLSGLIAHADNAAKGMGMGMGPTKTIAERHQNCSFLFAKVNGLSQIINDDTVDPKAMMACLQVIFDRFDALADMFGVQKVRKTANEYYLVAAGLPDPNMLPSPEDRACGIAGFGFAMINIMSYINLHPDLRPYGITFSCQVGIHSGSAIAGIIGHKTFQYDLCGDAVNTAARMCSYSKPSHINISETTYQLLKHRYGAVPRGELQIKGKGKMSTYFLLNMPVEQQEALKALAVPNQLSASLVSVVDRWAKSGKHLVHAAADDDAGGRSGSPGSLPVRPQPPKMGQGKGQSVSMISLPLHTNATAGPEGQAGGAKGAAGRDGGSGGTSLCA